MSAVKKGQSGDKVQLARKEGILIDYETGFEISNSESVKLGKQVGQRTQMAIQSGGLLVISSKTKSKTEKTKTGDPSELPEDFPGRHALIHLGINRVDEIKKMDRDAWIELKGIAEKTADSILDYFKE